MIRTNPRCRWILWAPLVLVIVSAPARAQMITGEISGTVQDSSGGVIPNATIRVTNQATGVARTTLSMANGEFVVTAVTPGTYTVKVEKTGFRSYERPDIVVMANQRFALGSVVLHVGQVTQTLEVKGQSEAVNTESADTTVSLSDIQVTDLGVKGGRDVMQLLQRPPRCDHANGCLPRGEISDTDPAGTGANGGQFGSFDTCGGRRAPFLEHGHRRWTGGFQP